ncbi:hypothetical protein [Paenibacillus sp. OAS669]|uniref:hypothetical protein n=1 Tax=Paenibacillus sp. OAS669 TaxID=2663821 RepID=UPI00178AD530|nr:hypothetical protein [Paenibacillus sp. OAS669]MBE1445622.1 hypothetical protein [Paenibacillus sp. OAS669]
MVRIHFYDLQIGTVSSSSGIFHGSNIQRNYKHKAKCNQAFGTVNGKHLLITGLQASLRDDDQFDTVSTTKLRNM